MYLSLDNTINIAFTFLILFIFIGSIFALLALEKRKSTLFVNYVPGILTSIGIFGTFLGICLGLMHFDPSEIKTSTPILIQGLRTAFFTSVLGLFTSMLFRAICLFKDLFVNHSLGSNVGDNLNEINQTLLVTVNQLVKNNELQQTICNEIKDFKINSLANDVKTINSLEIFLKNAAENNSKALIEALEGVMRDFNTKINEQFGDNFKQLNQAVEKLVAWQDNYILQIEKSDAALSKSIEVFNESSGLFKISSEVVTSVNGLAKSIEKVVDENVRTIDSMSTMLLEIDRIGQSADQVIPAINKNLDKITKEFGEQVQLTVKKTVEFVDLQNEQYKSAFESLRDNVKQNQTQMDQFIRTSTDTSIKSMEKVSVQQEENIKRQLMAIDQALGEELSKALEMLGTNLSALSNKFVDDYTPLTNRLKEIVSIAKIDKAAS